MTQLERLTSVMRRNDTTATQLRGDVGVSGLDTSDMVLVTADSVCAQVDSALMSASTSPGVWAPAVVYRLGTARFAAFHPGPVFTTVFFIDDRKQVLAVLQ